MFDPRPRAGRRALLISLTLACALALAGCFNAPAADGGGSDGRQRLSVVLSFPPAQGMAPFGDDALLLSRLGAIESLTALSDDGEPRPSLATKWNRSGARIWRFQLREGVLFHDDTALTAKHAARSLNAAMQAKPVPRALSGIKITARAEGKHTLTITTKEPAPLLPQRLSSPSLAILAPSAYTSDTVDPVRAGTGPFVLEQVQGTSGAKLSAFDRYWGGKPEAAGIDVDFVPDGVSRTSALRSGEADVVEHLPLSQAKLIDSGRILEVPLPRLIALHLNTGSGAFTDPGLRAAAWRAIEQKALASGVFEGRADPAHGLFRPDSPWAAGRLSAADLPKPAQPSGQRITLATYSDRPALPEVATVVAEKLRQRGFRVKQVVREYSEIAPRMLKGEFDAVIGARSYLLDTGNPGAYLASDMTCEGSYNLAQLCDPAVDAAVEDVLGSGDTQARRKAIRHAARTVRETAAVIPLVHMRHRIGVAAGVRGVAKDPFERKLITVETHQS